MALISACGRANATPKTAQSLLKSCSRMPGLRLLLLSALAVPKPPREAVERGREVAAVRAKSEPEPFRRHFLLCRRLEIREPDHASQLLVARASEESVRRLEKQRLQLGGPSAVMRGEQA